MNELIMNSFGPIAAKTPANELPAMAAYYIQLFELSLAQEDVLEQLEQLHLLASLQ